MKKKLTITIASILSVIVIIGVGFAAWVITNPDVKGEADGTISVETVTDKSYTLTAGITGTISFGAPETMNTPNAWLTNNGDTHENLTATLTLTLKYMNLADVGTITLKMETLKGGASDTTTTFSNLVNKGYLVNPTLSYKAKDPDAYTDIESKDIFAGGLVIPNVAFNETKAPAQDEQGEATATIKITFGWGATFENKNPYIFYNGDGHSYEKDYSNAKTALKAIEDLNGVSYKVTVTGTTAA